MMEDLNVVITGAAGEGIQTIGEVLAETIAGHGYAVFAWQEFESRIRGGQNSYSIRISEKPVNAQAMKADILLALNDGAAIKYGPLIQKDGILIAEKKLRDRMIPIAFSDIALKEFGDRIYANTMALGALAAAIGMNLEILHTVLAHKFAPKGETVVAANRAAAEKGYLLAREGCQGICPWKLPERDTRYRLISGTEALALAAVLAGCRFMAAYPMSPATDIITFLAKNEKDFEVFTEQAEDEIAAVRILVGWGSSRPALLEALERLQKNGIRTGMIHFTEMWPLPAYRFPEGKTYWSVENNATGQLARLLRSEYGMTFSGEVHRYDGLPLTGPYIQEALQW